MPLHTGLCAVCALNTQGFLGLALLAVSALSAILNILGGLTLGMAWIGLFVYFITGIHHRTICWSESIASRQSNTVALHPSADARTILWPSVLPC